MEAHGSLHAPPPGFSEPGVGAPRQRGGEKVSFAGKRAFGAPRVLVLQLCSSQPVWFPSHCSWAWKGFLVGSKRKELIWEYGRRVLTRELERASTHCLRGVCTGFQVLRAAERRADLEAAGPRWAHGGSAHPLQRWGCCCARCWDVRAQPRAAATGSPETACARFPVAALGICWTAVANGWRAFPNCSHPGLLDCKYSYWGRRGETARGLGTWCAAAFSRAAHLGPGLQRRSVGLEKEPSGPQSPFLCALLVALWALVQPTEPQMGKGGERMTALGLQSMSREWSFPMGSNTRPCLVGRGGNLRTTGVLRPLSECIGSVDQLVSNRFRPLFLCPSSHWMCHCPNCGRHPFVVFFSCAP